MNLPSSKLKLNFCYVLVFSLVFGLAIFYSPEKVEGTTGVPEIVSFQGRLTNAAGELRDGNFDFKFSIWNQAAISGGTKLWPADPGPGTVTLSVSSGVFNVNIGDTVNGYPDALNYNFQDNDTVYLQVEVYNTGTSSFETLSPRQQINSSGYAINAGSVLGKIPGTGNNNLLLLDGSGNIALAGGIDTGSTIQAGSSNVTLTLSTGFLDADALTLFSGADGVGVAQSASGLERQSDGLTLLQGCGDNQILKWDEIDDDWNCEDDLTGAGSASLDSLTAAIANSAALDSNAFTLNWNWDFTTAAVDSGLNISESSASTNGTQDQQALVKITTLSGSTASPLQITSNSADVGDIFINLASLGDFEIRDAGTAFVTFTDGGVTIISNADINGGAIDGTAIGASSASTGAFTTLSSTGATTLGNNSTTVGVNSNDWDIATDGTMTGIGAITSDGLITTTAGLTVTGAAVSLNTSSNFDVNIATGTSTGDITLGGGTAGQLISINSDDWDISTAGVMTGIGAIT
ncbi:MAG TPA: hypothetical protein VGQ87_02575, partial [Patescibacteria group bacterium]|nr:hypothetical protein [Patescibacteria group bacterium]